jgi:hypothetical protein
MRKETFLYLGFMFLAGCATASPHSQTVSGESREEVVSAMSHVVGAVSGQEMTEKDLRKLNAQIQKDPQAKSAVQAITNSMGGQGQAVKYCPIDGERYSSKFEMCPIHKVLLKIVGE